MDFVRTEISSLYSSFLQPTEPLPSLIPVRHVRADQNTDDGSSAVQMAINVVMVL